MGSFGDRFEAFCAKADAHRELIHCVEIGGDTTAGELTVNMIGCYTCQEQEEDFLYAYSALLGNESDSHQYIIFVDCCPAPFEERIARTLAKFVKNIRIVTSPYDLGATGCFLWGLTLCKTEYYLMLHNDCLIRESVFGEIIDAFRRNRELSTVACRHPKGGFIDSWCVAHPVACIMDSIPLIESSYRDQWNDSLIDLAFSGRFPNKAKYSSVQDPIIKHFGAESVLAMDLINTRIKHRFLHRYRRMGKPE